jgi:bacterioferritin-associated ferredoxin
MLVHLDVFEFESYYQIQVVLVCLCHPSSERVVDAAIDDGARSVEEIGQRCGAGTGCGSCHGELRERLQAKGCGRDCAPDLVTDLVTKRT